MKKTILILGILMGIFFKGDAQIQKVKFLIEYNDNTQLYDCKIVIIEGEAKAYPHRIQFNSQYTIVVPHDTELTIETLHNPLEENQFYNGTTPCLWGIGLIQKGPPVTPLLDYYAISPNLVPPSAYYNLYPGDEITIFSIAADVDPCENAVRLFENGIDPNSIEMPAGGDFSNGFTLGGGAQIYNGNLITDYSANYIASNDSLSICDGECISLIPNIFCLGDELNYEWSTGENTKEIEVCPESPTNYFLLIRDSLDNLLDSLPIFVDFDKVEINGPNVICSGESTILTPNTGGSWSLSYSSIPFVATIDNFGIVTGVYEGKVVFQYTDGSGLCGPIYSDTIYVLDAPEVSFVGEDRICIGSTSSVFPTSGGTWESLYPSVASIDANTGEITGLEQGNTTLTFTDDVTGCKSYALSLVVYDLPNTLVENDAICIGATTILIPSAGGVWSSINPEIATVSGNVVTGKSYGDAGFIFTDSTTGCSSEPAYVTVGTSQSTFITGPDHICDGEFSKIEPSSGGIWMSSDENVAIIDNQGNITGIGPGNATFIFTSDDAQCTTQPSDPIEVSDIPIVSVSTTVLCLSETMTVSPVGGTWTTDNPNVACVHSSTGEVTTISSGTTTFTYTTLDGCSATTELVTILPEPFEQNYEDVELCPGFTEVVTTILEGVWESDDSDIATVDPSTGLITAIQEGTTEVSFTDATTGCFSTIDVKVFPSPTLNFVWDLHVCEGEDTKIFSSTSGTWESNDNSIATIDTEGNIFTHSGGEVTFTFTSNDGCIAESKVLEVLSDTTTEIDTIICEGMEHSGFEGLENYVFYIEDIMGGCEHTTILNVEVLPASDPSCTVGIEDVFDVNVKIYPNPAKHNVFIEGILPIQSVTIYTAEYTKIIDYFFEEGLINRKIPVHNLTSGLYLVEVKSKGKTTYKKLIVE